MFERRGLQGGTLAGLIAGAMLAASLLLLSSPLVRLSLPAVLGGGSGPARSATVARYASLPQRFEPNRGQSEHGVDFLSRGNGYSLFLTGGNATLLLSRGGAHERPVALGMRLAGASAAAKASGAGRLPGTVNYLRGPRPSLAQTAIPTYRGVTYRGVYPGVDVRYYGSQRQLEYDFSLAPNADASQIGFDFSGARRISIAANGDLGLRLAGGTLRERAPVAFQRIGRERRPVAARYVVRGNHVSFALGAYDRSRPLTIDPVVLAYSSYLGGAGDDFGQAIAVDSAGSAYVAGWTTSADFPTTAGAVDTTQNGSEDAFVAKLAPDGRSLAYATYLGGSTQDLGVAIAVDPAGSAYVTGRTQSSDFPTTAGAFRTTAPGGPADAFVAKLAPDGQSLAYSTYLGGNDQDNGQAIAVDAAGSAYITGYADSTNFPTTPGAFDTALGGTRDDFVTKLAPDGKSLAYSTYLGGSGDEGQFRAGIAVDASGSAYVTDRTSSADFPTTPGAFDTTLGGSLDAFVTKLVPSGQSLAYSTYLGGSSDDDFTGGAIAVDSAGSAYTTGSTSSADFPTTVGASDTTLAGSSDAFVSKLAPTGQSLVYSTYLGGSADELGIAIAVDAGSSAYVTGDTFSADLPTTADALDTTLGGGQDAYVTKLAPNGQSLASSTYLGGSDVEYAFGIAAGPAGAAYVIGATFSADFPTTAGALDTTRGGSSDAYVAKLGGSSPTVSPDSGTPLSPTAPPPATAPTTPPGPPVAVGCTANKLILTDVFPRAGKTRLLGVAPRAAAGKQVTILSAWNGKPVASATVQPDLTFSAAAPLPPGRLRSTDRARYVAKFGSQRSLGLKFARRMYTTAITIAGRAITFTGTVTPPLAKPLQRVMIRASTSCSTINEGVIVATTKPSSRGAFTARLTPPMSQSVVYLRAETKVRKNTRSKKTFPTFTLIRGLKLGA